MQSSDRIRRILVEDIRFPYASLGAGSDASNPDPDYSNSYVTVVTDAGEGYGVGFTLGRGNEMVCAAVRELAPLVTGRSVNEIVDTFGQVWREIANPFQSRWIAPGGGPYHMAAGAIANAIFDLWAKQQGLPLWKALARRSPEQIVDMLDFRYVEHLLSREAARELLEVRADGREDRIRELETNGLPCYHTTWISARTDDLLDQIASVREKRGITTFKVKVGRELRHDHERLAAIRSRFGKSVRLYTDANQIWTVHEAIAWMRALEEYEIGWIEEPTAPDLVDGHRRIREGLAGTGIEVVTGENCPNAHVAAQFIAGGAVDRFQIDACRVIGPPENILIMLVAAAHGVPVCPHAGGSGLDELVPHLSAFNYVCCAPSLDRVVVEQVGFCADFFDAPAVVRDGRVAVPATPGYLVGMKPEAQRTYRFPDGDAWKDRGKG